MMKNVVLIDKPAGWTSFDVVAKIRGELQKATRSKAEDRGSKKTKVGHAGTLDPFATGLLVILLGDACKEADTYLKLDKTYEFTAKLGEVSTTGDPEGDKSQIGDRRPEIEEVKTALEQYTGVITQTPPVYSAIKIDGKRAYKLAREGKAVEIPSRQVTIYELELISYDYPYLICRCKVSSGTYIRSLVEDIGKSLKTGAYCAALRRTTIGKFNLEDAQTIDQYTNTSPHSITS